MAIQPRQPADSWRHAAFRLALVALPEWFRDRFAADMEATFLERFAVARAAPLPSDGRRRRPRTPALRVLLAELGAVARLFVRLRWSGQALLDLPEHPARVAGVMPKERLLVETLIQDFKFALRMVRRNPGFVAVAVLTLALGVGANATIFGMVASMMAPRLPYADTDELMIVWSTFPERGIDTNSTSPADFLDWRSQNETFVDLAAQTSWSANLTGGERPLRLDGYRVSANIFRVLGAQPLLGRDFLSSDDASGAEGVVMLSWRLWQRLGADPGLIGDSLRIDGAEHTVVGVMPQGFEYPQFQFRGDFWAPMRLTPEQAARRGGRNLVVVGRLLPDTTRKAGELDIQQIAEQLAAEHPVDNAGRSARLVAIDGMIAERMMPAFAVLLATVGAVLLICCANVANLYLARASVRRREIAVRSALGASRMRVVRQLLTESVVVATAGGICGYALSQVAGTLIISSLPAFVVRVAPSAIEGGADSRVLGFTMIVSSDRRRHRRIRHHHRHRLRE